MNGYLNILKPTGLSSAAVVGIIRRLSGEKRVGHAGTLDPEAAGVLPIMMGKATRLFDYLVDKEKEYVAVAAFGTATDTQDATGTVTETGDCYPSLALIREKAQELTGDIRQVPSMYSAIKVGGKPLYARARAGETAEVPERVVHVERIDVIREMPNHGAELRVLCGRGTYIRTLCDDLGRKCGCPAHMRSLTRTKSGVFTLDTALSLEEARALAEEGRLRERLLEPDWPLGHMPRTEIPARFAKKVAAGAALEISAAAGDLPEEGAVTRIYLTGRFWGIARRKGDQLVWQAQIAPEEETEA